MTSTLRPTLYVLDDDPATRLLVERMARDQGFNVAENGGGPDVLAHVAAARPDLMLADLQTWRGDVADSLRAIGELDLECQVVLMSADARIGSDLEAVKLGALELVAKPLDFDRLSDLLTTVRKRIGRREFLLQTDLHVAKRLEFRGLIGRSPAMQDVIDSVRRLAPHAQTLLLTGEAGTGKTLVAKALHAMGPRAQRPYETIDCSKSRGDVLERELFGHEGRASGADRSAGVLARVRGGTVCLDHLDELSPRLQASLMRSLEEHAVAREGSAAAAADVWVLAASRRDLRIESAAGRFRSDLLGRISRLEIRIPPLRDRREDIPLLVAAFLSDAAERCHRTLTCITTAAERRLTHSPWTGNVPQLRDVIERACMLSDGRTLSDREVLTALAAVTALTPSDPSAEAFVPEGEAPDDRLASALRAQIDRVLRVTQGNKSEAARLLGISRRSLYRWIERLQLVAPSHRTSSLRTRGRRM
jgi:two-component system response regulator HydG